MKYTIHISEQAEKDLRNIFEYISLDLLSVQNATKQIMRLEKSIFSLYQMPNRFVRIIRVMYGGRNLEFLLRKKLNKYFYHFF